MGAVTGTVCVIAGGWSVANVDVDGLPGTVIGVNESGLLPRCDIALSMDRLWTEHRWERLCARGKVAWIRDAALKCIADRPDWLRIFSGDYKSTEFSTTPATFNGTNSGYCALNLAFRIQPQTLYLVGFDMNRGPQGQLHWHPEHPWANQAGSIKPGSLAAWAKEFEHAAEQFRSIRTKVINLSPSSAITAFAKAAPNMQNLCKA